MDRGLIYSKVGGEWMDEVRRMNGIKRKHEERR